MEKGIDKDTFGFAIEPSIIAKIMTYELCIVFMDTDNPDVINETFFADTRRFERGKNVSKDFI